MNLRNATHHIGGRLRKRAGVLALALLASVGAQSGHSHDSQVWPQRLQAELALADAQHRADLGVYVRDLDTGVSASYRAGETWYLASLLKVPVAIAVLRGIERGDYALDTTLTLRAADFVDGAGATNRLPPGSILTIAYLLEQMIVYSDNTATDMLIALVGVRELNALLRSLVPHGLQRMTGFADVRRHVYAHLAPSATQLSGKDFLLLRQELRDAERLEVLARLLDMSKAQFRLPSLADAYAAYYAGGLNSGRLDAYGELLALLADGRALAPAATAYLLETMERVQTGPHRIKAGLPAHTRFAHKTGTQRSRVCDAGIITVPRWGRDQRIVVVACTRGEPALADAERALREVGVAICRSGLLIGVNPNETACDAVADPLPDPVADQP